jgi:DNA-binding transcriptional ArsR family regulator
MRSDAPSLLPVFRSRHQADLLTLLFLHPEQDHTVTELAARLRIPLTTAHRELARLEGAGLLTGRAVGRSRLLRANTDHRAFGPLAQLLLVSFGPHVVVAEEFAALSRISQVVIYGAWAARYAGVDGPAPRDIDVLIVGTPDRPGVYAAAERVETRLGIPVNPTLRSPARWQASDDTLVTSIKAAPHLTVADRATAADPEAGTDPADNNDDNPVITNTPTRRRVPR